MADKKEGMIKYADNFGNRFSDICPRAKDIALDWMGILLKAKFNKYDLFIENISPIEQIFYTAYQIYILNGLMDVGNAATDIIAKLPTTARNLFCGQLKSQIKIEYKGKTYYPDFILDFSEKNEDDVQLYPTLKNLKYIIELDGKEYHSTKEQMNHDYEREQNLQELGYKVIRFTGSQVYREPFTCVDKAVMIILNDMRKALGVE